MIINYSSFTWDKTLAYQLTKESLERGTIMKDLNSILNPKSVAVIGASADFAKLNGLALKYLLRHEFPGAIYPVNPKYEEIRGIKCYPSIG